MVGGEAHGAQAHKQPHKMLTGSVGRAADQNAGSSMDSTRQRWLKSEEAAERLGISIWTLRHWVSGRKITFVRKGRMVRFREEDLERFMNSGLVKANAAPAAEK